jgi:hypothetical protein
LALVPLKKRWTKRFGSNASQAVVWRIRVNSRGKQRIFFLKKSLAVSPGVDILSVFLRNAKEWTARQE